MKGVSIRQVGRISDEWVGQAGRIAASCPIDVGDGGRAEPADFSQQVLTFKVCSAEVRRVSPEASAPRSRYVGNDSSNGEEEESVTATGKTVGGLCTSARALCFR